MIISRFLDGVRRGQSDEKGIKGLVKRDVRMGDVLDTRKRRADEQTSKRAAEQVKK